MHDLAPLDVQVEDAEGNPVSLRSHLGKWVVIYFYPKDDTPGCTKEACSFRDANVDIDKLGVTIIGVSKDLPKSHQKFIKKYQLEFPLWSDPNHELMEAFGTWKEKKFLGKSYMGTTRSTFLINSEGKIAYVWPDVKPAGHAEEVLSFLRQNM